MTRAEEARIWRRIGKAFEAQVCGCGSVLSTAGLCLASRISGLPAYGDRGSRVPCFPWGSAGFRTNCADRHDGLDSVRALTAYLMAEMVADGCAPGDESEGTS